MLIADIKDYLIVDPAGEDKFKFNLRDSLAITSDFERPKLLEGLTFYATISVQPPAEELRPILESAGGLLLIIAPKSFVKAQKIYILGDKEDWKECEHLEDLGFTIYAKDLVLTGILRQSLAFKE